MVYWKSEFGNWEPGVQEPRGAGVLKCMKWKTKWVRKVENQNAQWRNPAMAQTIKLQGSSPPPRNPHQRFRPSSE